jgi:hypothetical protein
MLGNAGGGFAGLVARAGWIREAEGHQRPASPTITAPSRPGAGWAAIALGDGKIRVAEVKLGVG